MPQDPERFNNFRGRQDGGDKMMSNSNYISSKNFEIFVKSITMLNVLNPLTIEESSSMLYGKKTQ